MFFSRHSTNNTKSLPRCELTPDGSDRTPMERCTTRRAELRLDPPLWLSVLALNKRED